MGDPTPPLSQRDAAALMALRDLASDDGRGWSCSPRGRRLDRSGLSWDQWRRAVAALLAAQLVERVDGKRAKGQPDSYRLTDAGHEALTCGDRHTPPQVAATGSATPLGSCLSLEVLDSEGENQPTSGGGMAPPPQAGVAAPQVAPPQVDALRLLERVAVALEGLNVRVTHSLAEDDRALLRELFARAVAAPSPIATSSPPTCSSSEAPDCDCPLPMKQRNGPRGPFWGCARWRSSSEPGCGKTLPVAAEPHHRTSASQSESDRKARDEHRARVEAERNAVLSALSDGLSVSERVEREKARLRGGKVTRMPEAS